MTGTKGRVRKTNFYQSKKKPLLGLFVVFVVICLTQLYGKGRISLSGFMIWNVFLAYIPIFLQKQHARIDHVKQELARRVFKVLDWFLWLLFLPNAFYLLTDFMHLNGDVLVNVRGNNQSYMPQYVRGDGMYILDSLMFFSACLIGMVLGGLALCWFINKTTALARAAQVTSLAILMTLVGVGVYIGRFSRFNSWDAIIHPSAVVNDLLSQIGNDTARFITTVITIILFEILSVYVVQKHYKK